MRLLTIAVLFASAAVGSVFSTNANAASLRSQTNDKVAGPSSGYDPKIAMEALFYAKAAYCPTAAVANWTCASCGFNPGMKEVSVFTELDTQAYVGFDSDAGNVVVAIRGSFDLENWIDDFTFELVPYPACYALNGCRVHKGFYEVYQALAVDMVPAVKKVLLRHPGAPLFVTGHSLGAAISVHAALDLYAITKDRVVNVYNFGEPRVGDGNFSAYAVDNLPAKSQFRVTHHEDPVPHLPLLQWGFLHVPHEIFYDNDGNTSWVDCNDSYLAEDPKCSDQFPFPIKISDHTRYLGIRTECDITEDALRVRSYTQL